MACDDENKENEPQRFFRDFGGDSLDQRSGNRSRSPCHRPNKPVSESYLQDEDLMKLNRTREVFEKIHQQPHMSYNLPKPGSTAGRILAHATNLFGVLHGKHNPMTFKFGITHNPIFRWYHRPYGYKFGIEKFENMVIVYGASNPIGPAFLEASLIQKFGSHPAIH